MSNEASKQTPAQRKSRTSTPQSQSNKPTKELIKTPVSKSRKHAALKGTPTVAVSEEQWDNVNKAIVKTVDLVLAQNIVLDSFGPDYWEMDEGYGIALVAEIRRAIKEICSLSEPRLQRELRQMARDVTHGEFRFSCKGGGVWFRFKMTNLQKAIKPIVNQEPDSLSIVDKKHKEIIDKEEFGVNKGGGVTQTTAVQLSTQPGL